MRKEQLKHYEMFASLLFVWEIHFSRSPLSK